MNGAEETTMVKSKLRGGYSLNAVFSVKEFGIFLGLVALFVTFSVISPPFLTFNNIMNIIRQISILGIMSVGMTMVIVSGEIDLSVGSVYGMAGMVTAVSMTSGVPVIYSVIFGLLSGGLAGIINGVLVTYLRVPALIVTLGMMYIARGIAYLTTGGLVETLSRRFIKDPALDTFIFFGRGKVFDVIPVMSITFITIAIIGYFIYHKNIIGYRMRAVGGNADAARVSGLNVEFVKIAAFTITGLLAALGGIINCSFLNTGQGTAGVGLELDVIAATILGGTSLAGGEGSIIGTVIGVLILGVLRNGLVLVGVSPFLQMVIIGAVLIGAVAIDMWSKVKK
jgi:ribose/xylose/arabinose/galactoside ABC-type transport system permease subunit